MAGADYLRCAKCDGKAIYDADWYDRVTGNVKVAALCEECGASDGLSLTSRLDAATRRADEVGSLLREAIGELHRMSHHREDCHEYDEDVGLPKRDFSDDEEWDRVEMYAAETATRLTDALKRIDAAKEGR